PPTPNRASQNCQTLFQFSGQNAYPDFPVAPLDSSYYYLWVDSPLHLTSHWQSTRLTQLSLACDPQKEKIQFCADKRRRDDWQFQSGELA
ncbi:MAG: hypothetical protein O2983_16390, partial [Planctomycetota bacterium]|nr:hypothetical protein [Planctomycetota bacterium]